MIASRMNEHANDGASNTACPPRRSFVAKRRPPPWTALHPSPANDRIAFGAADFNVIVVA